MRKLIDKSINSLILILALTLALTACSSRKSPSEGPSSEPPRLPDQELVQPSISDYDGDGVQDAGADNYCTGGETEDCNDNCWEKINADQADKDKDGIGDACDNYDATDSDGDGLVDNQDNCPNKANSDQADRDWDGVGDLCDKCTEEDGFGALNGCPTAEGPEYIDCPTSPNKYKIIKFINTTNDVAVTDGADLSGMITPRFHIGGAVTAVDVIKDGSSKIYVTGLGSSIILKSETNATLGPAFNLNYLINDIAVFTEETNTATGSMDHYAAVGTTRGLSIIKIVKTANSLTMSQTENLPGLNISHVASQVSEKHYNLSRIADDNNPLYIYFSSENQIFRAQRGMLNGGCIERVFTAPNGESVRKFMFAGDPEVKDLMIVSSETKIQYMATLKKIFHESNDTFFENIDFILSPIRELRMKDALLSLAARIAKVPGTSASVRIVSLRTPNITSPNLFAGGEGKKYEVLDVTTDGTKLYTLLLGHKPNQLLSDIGVGAHSKEILFKLLSKLIILKGGIGAAEGCNIDGVDCIDYAKTMQMKLVIGDLTDPGQSNYQTINYGDTNTYHIIPSMFVNSVVTDGKLVIKGISGVQNICTPAAATPTCEKLNTGEIAPVTKLTAQNNEILALISGTTLDKFQSFDFFSETSDWYANQPAVQSFTVGGQTANILSHIIMPVAMNSASDSVALFDLVTTPMQLWQNLLTGPKKYWSNIVIKNVELDPVGEIDIKTYHPSGIKPITASYSRLTNDGKNIFYVVYGVDATDQMRVHFALLQRDGDNTPIVSYMPNYNETSITPIQIKQIKNTMVVLSAPSLGIAKLREFPLDVTTVWDSANINSTNFSMGQIADPSKIHLNIAEMNDPVDGYYFSVNKDIYRNKSTLEKINTIMILGSDIFIKNEFQSDNDLILILQPFDDNSGFVINGFTLGSQDQILTQYNSSSNKNISNAKFLNVQGKPFIFGKVASGEIVLFKLIDYDKKDPSTITTQNIKLSTINADIADITTSENYLVLSTYSGGVVYYKGDEL